MQCFHVCSGLYSQYFHIAGDGHQSNNRGLYIPIIRIPVIKGVMTISSIGSLDPGTCVFWSFEIRGVSDLFQVSCCEFYNTQDGNSQWDEDRYIYRSMNG